MPELNDEHWAGKHFTRISEESIKKLGDKRVPLTVYTDDEGHLVENGPNRHVIGTADVAPDGTFTAKLDDGIIIQGDIGVINRTDESQQMSFGLPVHSGRFTEVQVERGEDMTFFHDLSDIKPEHL